MMRMNEVNRKTQIAVLWIFLAVANSAAMLLYLYGGGPEVLDGIRAGVVDGSEVTTTLGLVTSLFWLVPLTMAFLALTLPHAANRWTNVVLGLAFAVLVGYDAVAHHLAEGDFGGVTVVVVGMTVVSLLIAWLGWRLPAPTRTAAPTATKQVAEHARV